MRITDPKAYWRDVLGNIEDLLPEWQMQPCTCAYSDHIGGDFSQCYRCKVVSAVTRLKALVNRA